MRPDFSFKGVGGGRGKLSLTKATTTNSISMNSKISAFRQYMSCIIVILDCKQRLTALEASKSHYQGTFLTLFTFELLTGSCWSVLLPDVYAYFFLFLLSLLLYLVI